MIFRIIINTYIYIYIWQCLGVIDRQFRKRSLFAVSEGSRFVFDFHEWLNTYLNYRDENLKIFMISFERFLEKISVPPRIIYIYIYIYIYIFEVTRSWHDATYCNVVMTMKSIKCIFLLIFKNEVEPSWVLSKWRLVASWQTCSFKICVYLKTWSSVWRFNFNALW